MAHLHAERHGFGQPCIPGVIGSTITLEGKCRVKMKLRNELRPDAAEFFRKQGAKGGKLGGSVGGKKAASSMTPEQRSERAREAVVARELKRRLNGD
jgi:hypothetical protein